VLLHGLDAVREPVEQSTPVNLDYPSRKKTIQELALETIAHGLSRCARMQARTVHFVTHSMGCVLVRYYLSQYRPQNLGRVVMLSPPNQGSEAADHLRNSALYQWLNGPAGQQLVTGPQGLPQQLGPVDFSLGIIAGSQHSFFDAWLGDVIPGTDDGKVSVERAEPIPADRTVHSSLAHPLKPGPSRTATSAPGGGAGRCQGGPDRSQGRSGRL
jgi:pimeloyl-ACP methyl ester carboxylesterase